MARFRNIAMLAEEVDAAGANAEALSDDAIEAAVDDPAPVVGETEEIAAQMEADDVAIDNAVADAEVLEETAQALEPAAEGGEEIGPVAAESIRILVAHIGKRNGLPSTASGIATESFRSKSNRRQAARIAMEGIESMAKNLWKMIVKAYEKAIEWVKKWWNKFFDGATKLKDRAEKLKKAAASKKGDEAKAAGKKITEEHAWADILADNGALTPKDVAAISSSVTQFYSNDVSKIADAVTLITESASNIFSQLDASNFNASLVGMATSFVDKVGLEVYKNHSGELQDGMETYGRRLGFGNKALLLIGFKSSASVDDVKDNAGHMKMWIDEAINAKDFHGDLDILTPTQVEGVADNVMKLAQKLIDDKNKASKLESSQKKLKDRAAKLADKAEDDDSGDNARAAGGLARALLSISTSGLSAIRTLFLSVGNAMCQYGQESLSELNKKDDTK